MVHHYETAICGTVVESCAHCWTVAHVSICSMTMHYLVAMANVGGVTLAMLHLGAVAYSLARCSTSPLEIMPKLLRGSQIISFTFIFGYNFFIY